jgi:hypothetical protein
MNHKNNFVGPAALSLALGLAMSAMIWAAGYARSAGNDQNQPSTEQWKIVMPVELKDGTTVKYEWGQDGHVVYFATEEACKQTLGFNAALIDSIKKVLLIAAERGDRILGIGCVLDTKEEKL